jgi:hypothetical protein
MVQARYSVTWLAEGLAQRDQASGPRCVRRARHGIE